MVLALPEGGGADGRDDRRLEEQSEQYYGPREGVQWPPQHVGRDHQLPLDGKQVEREQQKAAAYEALGGTRAGEGANHEACKQHRHVRGAQQPALEESQARPGSWTVGSQEYEQRERSTEESWETRGESGVLGID